MNSTNANTTTATQHAGCNSLPPLPKNFVNWVQVPLYQSNETHKNVTAVLEGCCKSGVWFYPRSTPCAAMCNLTSAALSGQVANCLVGTGVDFTGSEGSTASASGAFNHAPPTKSALTVLVVCGLVFSGMLL